MNYKFPEIRTIQDVLPAIEGRPEFIVAEREGYTVINYVVSMSNTFDMTGPDDVMGTIRRECRGLIFDTAGNIMSRPFHKFFNVNEREETQDYVLDMSQPHVIMEKMDGSMIRPVLVNGHLRLATKMGVTEVAMAAEAYLASRKDSNEIMIWMELLMKIGVTPIFEFVAPTNQIVIGYNEPDLVLLAIRHNETGNYLGRQNLTPAGLTLVPEYGSVAGNLTDYIARARLQEGREGDIIRFADGHMLKVKNDWYVRIHKTIDRVKFDRHIVELILNEQLDDAIGMLPNEQADRVRKFEADFWYSFQRTEHQLEMLAKIAREKYDGDRKRVALEFVPTLERKDSAAFIFGLLVGRDMREQMINHVKKHMSSNSRWAECANWLGMDNVSEVIEGDE